MTLMRPRYGTPLMPTLRDAIDRLWDESIIRPGEWLTLGADGRFTLPLDCLLYTSPSPRD